MIDQLKRILRLVRKTGDTMIVTDPNGEDVYVVMGLDTYEDLKSGEYLDEGMTDDEWDRYQEDRKKEDDWIWGSGPIDEGPEEKVEEKNSTIWNAMQKAGDEGETWDTSHMSETELSELEKQYKAFADQSVSSAIDETPIQQSTPLTQEEKQIKSPKKEEDFGEEQFYLEPVD